MKRGILCSAAIVAILIAVASTLHGQDQKRSLVHFHMIPVPGGEFMMGSDRYDDTAPRTVRVSPFKLSATEMTVADWRVFTEDQDIPFPWHSFDFTQWIGRPSGYQIPSEYAMYFITWYEAAWFANWLSELHDLSPVYDFDEEKLRKYLYGRYDAATPTPAVKWNRDANGYRLPTEAEWEYAATERGTIEDLSRHEILNMGWVRENAGGRVHEPGQKQPSALGHFDLLGNVSEWIWDYYAPDQHEASPEVDPAGPPFGRSTYEPGRTDVRVARGPAWVDPVQSADLWFRSQVLAPRRSVIGVRLAQNIE